MEQYAKFTDDIHAGKIVSAYALDRHGVVSAVSKMAFGNKMGVKLCGCVEAGKLFAPAFGDIIAEVPADKVDELAICATVIGEVTADETFRYGDTVITLAEAEKAWTETLEEVFRTASDENSDKEVESPVYDTKDIYICNHKIAQPHVFIPVFPGTNYEYDSTKAFERAGATVTTKVFKNMSAEDIRSSGVRIVGQIQGHRFCQRRFFRRTIFQLSMMGQDAVNQLIFQHHRKIRYFFCQVMDHLCSDHNVPQKLSLIRIIIQRK